MQLENILPSASINLPKTFYNLSSSDSANNSPRPSSQLDYQEVDRAESESSSAPKKYLSVVGNGSWARERGTLSLKRGPMGGKAPLCLARTS
ncbi:hypothetical protein KUCAC02_011719 [Chaenocephalus aceratus]|uniref:Uncharacterized protein n=1 Tax=Chaenocephalus aceratus TaxID=36190 RepID=A0ACB9WXS2_CHAAC|nr:hypothetical protein KUCAC02_011719 [Chaenocephalus aceratus]